MYTLAFLGFVIRRAFVTKLPLETDGA